MPKPLKASRHVSAGTATSKGKIHSKATAPAAIGATPGLLRAEPRVSYQLDETGKLMIRKSNGTAPAQAQVRFCGGELPKAGHNYVLVDDPTPGAADATSAEAFEPGPWARAFLRGRTIQLADLKASGGTYSLEQVQQVLGGISRQQVHDRVASGKLLTVPGPSNRRRYPVIQFNERGEVIEGLSQVMSAIDDSPWIVLNFLIHPDARLQGCKPIDLLEEGQVERVVSAARKIGEAGA